MNERLWGKSLRPEFTAFSSYGIQAASPRVRVFEWLKHTQIACEFLTYAATKDHQIGTFARNAPSLARAELITRSRSRRDFSRVLIHREVTPFSSGGIEERIARNASLSVYDFDDALMWRNESPLQKAWSKAEKCRRSVVAVDRVIAGSEVLAEWANTLNRDVRLIPTCVEPKEYGVKRDYEIGPTPRLVWLGSPSTEKHLLMLADPMRHLNALTGARLVVISGHDRDLGKLNPYVDRIPWRLGIERSLFEYDAAVAPLMTGPFESGKCAYKTLQYAAAGLPAVASPVGANTVVASQLGFEVADSAESWADSVMDLLTATTAERRGIGARAREQVTLKYSYEAWAPQWLDAIGESR